MAEEHLRVIRTRHEKHQMASIRTTVMEPETTKNIAYIVMVITLLAMGWFISQRAMKNRSDMLEASAPKIAGEDVLGGGARQPQQFDEPDEEALEEMAKLLGEEDESEDEA